jgi:hypothetical protein
MSKCLNCGSAITCSCQKVVAADGKTVCKNCVASYNQQLNIQKSQPKPNSVAPSGVTATYVGPGKQVNLGDL